MPFVVSTFSVKYVNQFDSRNGSERLTYTKERVLSWKLRDLGSNLVSVII